MYINKERKYKVKFREEKDIYIDKKEFNELLAKYKQEWNEHISEQCMIQGLDETSLTLTERDQLRPQTRTYNKIAMIFLTMTDRIMDKSNFSGYTEDWKDDMHSTAMYDCVRGIRTFNPETGNGYSYFTSAIHLAFIRTIKRYKAKKEKEMKYSNEHYEIEKVANHGKR